MSSLIQHLRTVRTTGATITLSSKARGVVSLVIATIIWELIARCPQIFGFTVPIVGVFPAPSLIFIEWSTLLPEVTYWSSWALSLERVLLGFTCAALLAIPLGLLFATNRLVRGILFPLFEILRPIPPIAWVPAAIIFWPTQELSIIFVIFLGAFYTIALNTYNGARQIDVALVQSALSMGAGRWYVFRRIVLPASLPSIITGASIGMGITWEVVVAAELISGSNGGDSATGLGIFMWNAYTAGNHERIFVAMLSIGIAGYISSSLLRKLGSFLTPWVTKG